MVALTTAQRAELRQLDADFPTEKANFINSPIVGMDSDIASVREELRGSTPVRENRFANAKWILDCNKRKLARDLATYQKNRLDWRNSKKDREILRRYMQEAFTDKDRAHELAQYRMFELTSDILSMPFAMAAFQNVNLSADEIVQIITPKARQHFNIRYIGQDGGARKDQWRTTKSATELEMKMLSTDRVEYPLTDLQQGRVDVLPTIDSQLSWDMEMKLDEDARLSLEANKAASGLRDEMNIHPLVVQANIPDSNHLDLTDVPTYGTANTLTITRLKAILRHINRWSFGVTPDGPISLQNMIMSPQNAEDSWEYVDLVAGFNKAGAVQDPVDTVTPDQRDSIFSTGGMMQSAWGYSWVNQFNTRLAKGKLYVLTNQPVGWFFTKTEFDRVIEWKDDPDHVEQNYGEILHQKAALFVQPTLWRYRYIVVDF